MNHLDEYRDATLVRSLAQGIRARATRPWKIMEICGGQTHTFLRYGLDDLLPPGIQIVHGPGCPVCVTGLEMIDKAVEIARRPGVIFCSYGDMLRVPGSGGDLFSVRASGGDVRIVYSPLEAVRLAAANPDREVVFFAIGFETTAPAHALAVLEARREKLNNFTLLVSHVLVPPAIRAILSSPSNQVQGFIAPGHVCAIAGYADYEELASEFKVPIVVGGFEPVDLMQATLMLVDQLESGRTDVENQYVRSVNREGNRAAREAVAEVFEISGRKWRGIGHIPQSGMSLRPEWNRFNAETRFQLTDRTAEESPLCISAMVLQGLKKPVDCPAFGTACTPTNPLGAPMVSNEGACSAYYAYKTQEVLA